MGFSLRCFGVGGSTRDSTVCSGRGSVVILLRSPEYICRCTVTSVAVKYDGEGGVSQLWMLDTTEFLLRDWNSRG